jgi:predicted nucleotidyltransferase
LNEKIFDDLLKNLVKAFRKNNDIKTVVVFGSVARGDAKEDSDLDLCIVCSKKARKKISDKLLDFEKHYNKNISVIFTDDKFTDLDRNYIETIVKEGKVLKGQLPEISLNRLALEPYEVLQYDLNSLSQSDKMRVKRLLYGFTSKKRYKGKVYESRKIGLVKKIGGMRIGRASIMIPVSHVTEVEMALRELGAKLRRYTVWMSKA